MAACRGLDETDAALKENLESSLFQPFHLLWFGPGDARGLWTWDGQGIAYMVRPSPPVTTSSWNFREVERERRRIFSERVRDLEGGTPETLETCHRATSSKGAACGVLINRENACTVSLCRADIDTSRVRMTCRPRLPGGGFGASRSAEIPRMTRSNSQPLSSCP